MIWRGCSTRAYAAGSTIMDGSVLRHSILPCGTSSDTWRDGPPESTSPYADTSGVPDTGLRASLNVSLGCSPIGPCSMDTAEQWEPDDARVSRPVLRERGGETPPRHSPVREGQRQASAICGAPSTMRARSWKRSCTAKRDKAAAVKLLQRIMKKYGSHPSIVTDGLRAYSRGDERDRYCPIAMRSGLAPQQSRGEFAPADSTARAQDAAFQIAGISSTLLVHSCRRSQHVQRPAPSHIPPHAPRPQRRSVPDVASRHRGLSANWRLPNCARPNSVPVTETRDEISGNRGGNINGPLVRQRVNQCGQIARQPLLWAFAQGSSLLATGRRWPERGKDA